MASFNRVILMGNLTRDPEIRYTQGGMPIVNCGLAVNRRFKDSQSGEWKEEPTFVDITIFGKRGEAFSRFHSKGKPAFIEGSLRLDQWEDKNGGGKRSKLYVVADNWEFVGGGKGEGFGGGGGGGGYEDEYSGGGSAPQGGYAASGGAGGGGGGAPSGGGGGGGGGAPGGGFVDVNVDDTPF